MTGLDRSVSAISRTSARVASSASSTSSSNRLPCRTSMMPSKPSRGSAPCTALPWGSRISGLGITSTITRAMRPSYRARSSAAEAQDHQRGDVGDAGDGAEHGVRLTVLTARDLDDEACDHGDDEHHAGEHRRVVVDATDPLVLTVEQALHG